MLLLISQNVTNGGLILIDEPELHLNPAVCKLLLPFLIERYLKPRNIQAIICSHSPELLAVAFDRTDCSLHHLQSSTAISKIYPDDKSELFDALKRLGTSASDVMFSRGSIYVEGEHDVDILQEGFSKLVARYNITHLGGRTSVEKEIVTLQKAENNGKIDSLKCFIFDLDGRPTSLTSTKMVRVLQWKRRCLENFLIDEKIVYDILNKEEIAANKLSSRGEVAGVFKRLALAQLPRIVINDVYSELNYENAGIRSAEIADKDYNSAAGVLFDRIDIIKGQLTPLKRADWCADFKERCDKKRTELTAQWDVDWLKLCDGKRFFRDLHSEYKIKVSPLRLKRLIIEKMEAEGTEGWVFLEKQIIDALKP